VSQLCKTAQIKRSSFYKWSSNLKSSVDLDEELIEEVFRSKKAKVGARRIRMYLMREYGVIFNLKKIRRIMKKRGLNVLIRKRRPQFYFLKDMRHRVLPNRLKQNFKIHSPDRVYSTDITYLNYSSGERAYLSAVKDLGTKEIVHHSISRHIDLSLVVKGLSDYLSQISELKRRKMIMHSDQGAHYTSHVYRRLLKKNKIKQSMSRRGNCLDNAPIESFFGHFKDESEYKNCKTFEELKNEVDKYIKYYNNERPQWGLNGKTPVEYRGLIN
jgi:putative transposase